MARKGGLRRKKVGLMTKTPKKRGKLSHRSYLAEYEQGQKVALVIESSIQAGMYHPRFAGKTGTIKKRLGSTYEVEIVDIKKKKTLVVHPIHLKRL